MNETDKAYMAALIDGEGTLGVYSYNNSYNISCSIGSQDVELLNWVNSLWPGRVWKSTAVYYWRPLGGKEKVKALLLDILPYLRTKKLQAENILAFYEVCHNTPPDDYVQRSKELNSRLKKAFREVAESNTDKPLKG